MPYKKKIILSAVCVLLAIITVIIAVYCVNCLNDRKQRETRSREFEAFYQQKLSSFAAENESVKNADLLFLGDSLTDLCDLPIYYCDYVALNRGISGDTSYRLKDRMQVSAYAVNTKAVILLIGGNDILSGKTLESIYANYESIICGIKENMPASKIIWCSLTAMGNNWAVYNEKALLCNQQIKLMANAYDCTFVDLFTPLYDEQTGEIRSEYTIEGVHFTHEGYLVVSAAIKLAVNCALS